MLQYEFEYSWAMDEDSVAQSELESWMIQRLSIQMCFNPMRFIISMASRKVLDNLAIGISACNSARLPSVSCNGMRDSEPQQWLRVAYEKAGVLSSVINSLEFPDSGICTIRVGRVAEVASKSIRHFG